MHWIYVQSFYFDCHSGAEISISGIAAEFLLNFVFVLDKNGVHISTAESTESKVVIALFPYEADNKNELTFKKGEKLIILDEWV